MGPACPAAPETHHEGNAYGQQVPIKFPTEKEHSRTFPRASGGLSDARGPGR